MGVDDLTRAEGRAEWEYRHTHGSSFGAAAAAYAEHRPGYAEAAVRWALEPVSPREPLRVLDLAAGTGKLTAALVGLGAEVTAVEPDPAMLAELRRELGSVRSLPGRQRGPAWVRSAARGRLRPHLRAARPASVIVGVSTPEPLLARTTS